MGSHDKYILTFRMTKHVLKNRYSASYLVKILKNMANTDYIRESRAQKKYSD